MNRDNFLQTDSQGQDSGMDDPVDEGSKLYNVEQVRVNAAMLALRTYNNVTDGMRTTGSHPRRSELGHWVKLRILMGGIHGLCCCSPSESMNGRYGNVLERPKALLLKRCV